jgi:hypothetical protein
MQIKLSNSYVNHGKGTNKLIISIMDHVYQQDCNLHYLKRRNSFRILPIREPFHRRHPAPTRLGRVASSRFQMGQPKLVLVLCSFKAHPPRLLSVKIRCQPGRCAAVRRARGLTHPRSAQERDFSTSSAEGCSHRDRQRLHGSRWRHNPSAFPAPI